jgi:hypothetical protein
MLNARDHLNLKLVDYGPATGKFPPDWIVSASGFLTMKSGGLFEVLESTSAKQVKGFHREATKRGHASLLTTPLFWFWVEGSRMIDFYGSAWPFGSYVIFSSRRIKITPDIAVVPDAIARDGRAKVTYEKAVRSMMDTYHWLMEQGFNIDEARRALPLGFASYGFMSWPLQLLFGMVREAEREEWMPAELKDMAHRAMALAGEKVPDMVKGLEEMPYDTTYPHRSVFRSPRGVPMTGSKLLLKEIDLPEGELSPAEWKDFVERAKTRVLAKLELSLSMSAWNDIKRQRTVFHEVEPLYTAAERGDMHVPPRVAAKEKALARYEGALNTGMEAYEQLQEQVPAPEAAYVLPHALKVNIRQVLNGYHFFDPFGFYGIRLCTHTDYEIRGAIARALEELGDPELSRLVGPKCKMGFCPERNFCAKVLKYRPDYTREEHQSHV